MSSFVRKRTPLEGPSAHPKYQTKIEQSRQRKAPEHECPRGCRSGEKGKEIVPPFVGWVPVAVPERNRPGTGPPVIIFRRRSGEAPPAPLRHARPSPPSIPTSTPPGPVQTTFYNGAFSSPALVLPRISKPRCRPVGRKGPPQNRPLAESTCITPAGPSPGHPPRPGPPRGPPKGPVPLRFPGPIMLRTWLNATGSTYVAGPGQGHMPARLTVPPSRDTLKN